MMDRYPEEEELAHIEEWPHDDYVGLMEFVEDIWKYAEIGYFKRYHRTYWLSTGGWSGNEEIIGALMRSKSMFWAVCWVWSERGGHYKFEIPKGCYNPKRKKK